MPGFKSNTDAKLTYNDDKEKEYPDPVIQTLLTKIQLLKIDAASEDKEVKTPLANAKFALYRKATSEEIAADQGKQDNEKQVITVEGLKEGDAQINVVQVATGTSAADGTINFDKLIPGTYYLQETEAPAMYTGISGFYSFVIEAGNYDKENPTNWKLNITNHTNKMDITVSNWDAANKQYVITVPNTMTGGVELPSSGGPGTTWIYLLGAMLLLGCGITLIVRRRMGTIE